MTEKETPVALDRLDRRILEELQRDGRLSNQALAERVGLSPSPCLRRVRTLEQANVITGYRALVDARRLGYRLMALLHISMDRHTPERFANFEAQVAALPEVQECLMTTGQEVDYQLKITVEDMDDYQRLLLEHITPIEGVSGVHSNFVLRQVFGDRGAPVSQLHQSPVPGPGQRG
ncbi:AsnC family transcriptional regulator [Kushneria sinocarnis]|uniref:AsnC family transcriptional regulator n=1 Tax=Kushneria sinocarnis TaxID=595502 RepID=A0A420WUR6_9GAMM|nr:Lrp/AsnC family transcriptional regulator [Kushneria sinocarnis]RKQ97187.1 AsnC family transcriptional regulator [Kushneria sinocarnis]